MGLFQLIVAPAACILFVVIHKAAGTYTAGREVDRWDIYHPLDEGLWIDTETPSKRDNTRHPASNNDEEKDELREEDIVVDVKFKGLRNDLRMAEIDSLRLFSKPPLPADAMQPMTYGIFKTGQSALRTVDEKDQHLILPEILFGLQSKRQRNRNAPAATESLLQPHHYRVCAVLLLLRGYSDAAHEVLLGVSLDNLQEAEYAATHRGETDWAQKHPLSDAADILHAAIHRMVEGNQLGEGDQTGYDNAKYWLAGGPKLLEAPAHHPIRETLVRIAREHTPKCVAEGGVIAGENGSGEGVEHTVLSGGGKSRVVCVPCGQWDDFAFLELCQRWADGSLEKDIEDEVATLQRAEIILLLRHELMECLCHSSMLAK